MTTPGSLVVAFVMALRNTYALAETLDTLTSERWRFDMERHRWETRERFYVTELERLRTELRFTAAELAETQRFLAALSAEVLPETTNKGEQ